MTEDDLTARARIRDAALAEFAQRGTAGTTIRAVAARAGVSPALVQHHFRTKDGLRAACDAHVLDYLRAGTKEGLDEGRIGDPAFVADIHATAPPVMRYLARALVDGSPAAAALFDETAALTERYLADLPGTADVHARAVVYTAMKLGVTVLHEHVARGLGQDPFTAGAARVGRATLDVTAPELLPPGVADQVRRAL